MSAEEQAPSASEYIVHHLTHWQTRPQTEIVDFSVFNIDSLFFSILLGVLGCFFLWKAARHATSGVPGRVQAAVEILFEIAMVRPRRSFTMRPVASWWLLWH